MENKWKGPRWWDEIINQTCVKHFEYHKQKYIDVIKTIRENHKDLLVHLAIYLRRIEAAIDAFEEQDPQKLTKVRQSLIETFEVLEAANPSRFT
jgi:hypothetical protein